MIILLIDTTDNKEIRVGLRIGDKERFTRRKVNSRKAQVVLLLIDKVLTKNNLQLGDVGGIEVNTKEGSFTGIRVGMSVANALGFTLKIPVKKVLFVVY